jgi:hypothetical protein
MSVQLRLAQVREQLRQKEMWETTLKNWATSWKRTFNGVTYVTKKDRRMAQAAHRAEKSFGKEPKHGRKEKDCSAP